MTVITGTTYRITDKTSGDVYPAETLTDVEMAVSYIVGNYPTDAEEIEFAEMLDDLQWSDRDYFTYPYLGIEVEVVS